MFYQCLHPPRNLIIHNPDQTNEYLCRYHGRRFHNDGKFKSMPEFQDAENFPRPCDDLHKIQLNKIGPFLFINLIPGFRFSELSDVFNERIGFLPLHKFKHESSLSKDYLVNCHWAIYCDNYLEGFHIPFVHEDLNKVLDYGKYSTEIYTHLNLQIGYANDDDSIFDLPPGHIDFGKNVAAYYFWVFPNMMFNFYPWGLSINIIKPISINKTKVSFISYVFDKSKIVKGAGAILDKVEMEDEFVVESVTKGMRSRFYHSGRFSPSKEKGVHHFHNLLAKYL
jgi:choline monooxygenase